MSSSTSARAESRGLPRQGGSPPLLLAFGEPGDQHINGENYDRSHDKREHHDGNNWIHSIQFRDSSSANTKERRGELG